MHIQLTWKSIRVVYGNVNERIEQFFNWGLQSDYHFVIGLKISCHFFHQWENKNQSRSARTGFLALWTSHVLFFHILIGLLRSKTDAICQNYFGFTTLHLQTLWLLFSRFILCKLQQYRERISGIPERTLGTGARNNNECKFYYFWRMHTTWCVACRCPKLFCHLISSGDYGNFITRLTTCISMLIKWCFQKR